MEPVPFETGRVGAVAGPNPSSPELPAVEIARACAGYLRRPAVRDVDLRCGRGNVFALLGRNGSGKSTLVACLMGFRPVQSGTVRLLGLNPWRERARLMRVVGYVPETPNARGEDRVEVLARYRASFHPTWESGPFHARLERFGISPRTRFGELSRGQKTLVQLALALAQVPELLILDDPTLGLDPVARRFVFDELIGELAERRTTVFLTSHDLEGVERVATHVGILVEGRLVITGELEQLRQQALAAGVTEPTLESIFVARTGAETVS